MVLLQSGNVFPVRGRRIKAVVSSKKVCLYFLLRVAPQLVTTLLYNVPTVEQTNPLTRQQIDLESNNTLFDC